MTPARRARAAGWRFPEPAAAAGPPTFPGTPPNRQLPGAPAMAAKLAASLTQIGQAG
jgi:hypothetical protein